MRSDLAVVCSYFNPTGSKRRLENYRRFRSAMAESGVRVLTVQLSFRQRPGFDLPSDRDTLRISGGDILWQKERLLQIGADRLIEEGYPFIVLMDADIRIEPKGWPRIIRQALDEFPVVQCFSECVAHYDDTIVTRPSSVCLHHLTGTTSGSFKGFAWALHAELLTDVGLYQHCIVGGGDSALHLGAIRRLDQDDVWHSMLDDQDFIKGFTHEMKQHYEAWSRELSIRVDGRAGYAALSITAFPHGRFCDRRYTERHRLLEGFRPNEEIRFNGHGAWVWVNPDNPRRQAIEEYFRLRNEDGKCSWASLLRPKDAVD